MPLTDCPFGPSVPSRPLRTRLFKIALQSSCLYLATWLTAAANDWSALDDRIRKAMRAEKVPGAALVVVDPGGIVYQRGYGYADRLRRQPVTEQTRFPLANVTKIVTAILILQEVQAGRLTLDQGLDTAMPDLVVDSRFPEAAAPTIRQLLSHHSGLPTNRLAGNYRAEPAVSLAPIDDLYLAQQPGSIYSYSNRAYVVLGHLLEQLNGTPFDKLARTRVLEPLGMDQAGFDARDTDARGHSGRGRVEDPIYARDLPAMGLRGSIDDLGRLMHWMLRPDPQPLLTGPLRQQMSRVQNADVALDLDNRAGLAWQLTNTDGFAVDTALRITASTLQFRGTVIVIPEHGIGLALLANSSEGMDFVLDQARRAVDELLARRAGIAAPDRDEPVFAERIALPDSAEEDAMQAQYNTPLGLMAFDGQVERPDVDYLGKAFRASRRSDGWYELSYRLLGLISIRFDIIRELLLRPARIGQHQVLLVNYQGRTFLFGTALSGNRHSEDLASLAGRYRLVNPDFFSQRLKLRSVTLEYRDGVLYGVYKLPLFISLKPRIPLVEHRANEFYIPGLGTAQGERLLYDPDKKTLDFAGYRFTRDR